MAKEIKDKSLGMKGAPFDGKEVDTDLLGRKTKRKVLLHTTNYLEEDGSNPKTTILYRSGKKCLIKGTSGTQDTKVDGDVTYVIWVRHCHSCSNAAGDGIDVLIKPMAKMREPLCTALGSRQALDAGVHLKTLLTRFLAKDGNKSNLSNCCLRFYSSFLPRTFQTAKLMAASYADNTEDAPCSLGERTVKRLCYVSEEIKGYEEAADYVRPSGRGSQSKTTITKSKEHANYLDKYISADFGIEEDNEACGTQDIAGSSSADLPCDYSDFLEKVLPTLKSTAGDCASKTSFNVIVSHGGYIRKCVLQSTKKHPANTQMYLVKYTRPSDPEFPMQAEILMTQAIPGMQEYESKPLPKHNEKLYEAAKKVNTDCSYTYHETIAPKAEEKEGEKKKKNDGSSEVAFPYGLVSMRTQVS